MVFFSNLEFHPINPDDIAESLKEEGRHRSLNHIFHRPFLFHQLHLDENVIESNHWKPDCVGSFYTVRVLCKDIYLYGYLDHPLDG